MISSLVHSFDGTNSVEKTSIVIFLPDNSVELPAFWVFLCSPEEQYLTDWGKLSPLWLIEYQARTLDSRQLRYKVMDKS